jgi:hypothetical protein
MQASLLLSSWGCCPHCNGVAVIDAQASSQSRNLCHCQNIVVTLAAMASMRSSSWCPHPCHNGFAIVTMALLPSLHWCHCQDCTGVVLPLLPLCCSPYGADLFALMSHWHHHRHYTSVVAPVNLACLRCCASVVALDTLALLPSMRWHYCLHCAGLFALVVFALCS